MKKYLKITYWTLFVAGVGVLFGFAQTGHRTVPCEEPIISINKDTGHDFVTETEVKQRLKDVGYTFSGQEWCEIDLMVVESVVRKIPGVETVNAYTYVNGKLQVDVKQRRPILRIINKNGSSFYLDDKGNTMPLSDTYKARIPIVTGTLNELSNQRVEEIIVNDSLANESLLDELYEVAKLVDANEFWQQQIVQMVISPKRELEIIPRVGGHRILMGEMIDMDKKLNKLELFYEKAIQSNQLNLYDTLTVKYKGQIVCSKKN